jgi:MFS family permease
LVSRTVGGYVDDRIDYGTRRIDSEMSFRLPLILQLFPAVLLGLGSYLLPFSPRWLVSRGRERESLDVLAKLRERSITDPSVVAEYRDINLEITLLKDTETTWRELFTGRIRRRTLLGVGIMFFQQFSGINALLYYAYSQHQQRY